MTDYREFGTWFRVALEGPFVPGRQVKGRITWPGAGHLTWIATVQRMEHERLFSFTWHPYAIDPAADYCSEPQTLVDPGAEYRRTCRRKRVAPAGHV